MAIDGPVQKYLDHLKVERRVTPATLKNYRSTLLLFSQWLGKRPFTEEAAATFLAAIPHAPSANVMGVRIQGLAKHMKKPMMIVRAKESVKPIEALNSSEVQQLITSATRIDPTLPDVVTFLSETGLRFGEFCTLNESALRTRASADGNIVHWLDVYGKGRKLREVPLSPAALTAFQRIPLGLTVYQQNRLRKQLARAGKEAKLQPHVHPHLLRASFVSILLNEQKREAIKVAKITGHASVDMMLKHYYRASIEDLHQVVYTPSA